VCNGVARAIKIFSGTGSLQASHGCCALTVLKKKELRRRYFSSRERQSRLCATELPVAKNLFWHWKLKASHGCSAHTVLKNKELRRLYSSCRERQSRLCATELPVPERSSLAREALRLQDSAPHAGDED